MTNKQYRNTNESTVELRYTADNKVVISLPVIYSTENGREWTTKNLVASNNQELSVILSDFEGLPVFNAWEHE